MGWRALRLALERDGLMKAQARALLEAAAGRTLNVMFPMVSEPWEFDEAQGAVRGAARLARIARAASCRAQIRYGAMLEVPALAEAARPAAAQARFPVDRHQRPDPVPVRRRSRQSQACRALRLAEPGDPALPAPRRRRRARAAGVPLGGVRRDGRAAAGGDGADRARHRPAVDHAGRGRPDQGDDPLARSRRADARGWPALLAAPPRDMRGALSRLGGAKAASNWRDRASIAPAPRRR